MCREGEFNGITVTMRFKVWQLRVKGIIERGGIYLDIQWWWHVVIFNVYQIFYCSFDFSAILTTIEKKAN